MGFGSAWLRVDRCLEQRQTALRPLERERACELGIFEAGTRKPAVLTSYHHRLSSKLNGTGSLWAP